MYKRIIEINMLDLKALEDEAPAHIIVRVARTGRRNEFIIEAHRDIKANRKIIDDLVRKYAL